MDFTGILRDGRPLAIECKRLNWTFNHNEPREALQLAYIRMVRDLGGMAGFATCAEDAIKILEGS